MLELVWDGYDADYYGVSHPTDPQGPAEAAERIRRGSGWASSAANTRLAERASFGTTATTRATGFRVARTIAP